MTSFAKDLGDFDSLDALKARVRANLEAEARENDTRQVRAELLKALASRLAFDPRARSSIGKWTAASKSSRAS
jgi:FKBP-type peptidyl-prolyl cis-trans isomerase (trigger factor)